MSTVLAFLHQHWSWIVYALIPSLITGLSDAPAAAGVVKWLKLAFQVLSVVTHNDQPGTFKLPFITTAAHQRLVGGSGKGGPKPAATALIFAMGLLAVAAGCGKSAGPADAAADAHVSPDAGAADVASEGAGQ